MAGRGAAGLAVVTVGVFVTALDQTVVVTAIPEIIPDLGIDFANIDRAAWIVTAFLVGYAAVLPLAGRLADMYSFRRVYLWGLAVFAGASVIAAVSPNLWTLIAARFVQAAGGGALIPVSIAFASAGRGRRTPALVPIAIIVAAAEAGGVVGPLWGAAVTHLLSWRWIFYLNLPLSGVIAVFVWRLDHQPAGDGSMLDRRGALLATVGLALLVTGLARDQAMPGWLAVSLLLAGLVSLVAFVLGQRRRTNPLVDIALFARRAFLSVNVAAALLGGGLIVPMVNTPLYAATVLERDTLAGGLLLLRMTVMIPIGAIAGGLIATKVGERRTIWLGALVAAAGLLLAAGWSTDSTDLRMMRDLAIAGFGFGLLIAPLTGAAVRIAGRDNAGVAAALVTMSRVIGMMLTLAAFTPWALARFNESVSSLPLPIGTGGESPSELDRLVQEYSEAITNSTVSMFNDLFLVGAILCIAAAIPTVFLAGKSLTADPKQGGNP